MNGWNELRVFWVPVLVLVIGLAFFASGLHVFWTVSAIRNAVWGVLQSGDLSALSQTGIYQLLLSSVTLWTRFVIGLALIYLGISGIVEKQNHLKLTA